MSYVSQCKVMKAGVAARIQVLQAAEVSPRLELEVLLRTLHLVADHQVSGGVRSFAVAEVVAERGPQDDKAEQNGVEFFHQGLALIGSGCGRSDCRLRLGR